MNKTFTYNGIDVGTYSAEQIYNVDISVGKENIIKYCRDNNITAVYLTIHKNTSAIEVLSLIKEIAHIFFVIEWDGGNILL